MSLKVTIEGEYMNYWIKLYTAGEHNQYLGLIQAKDYRIDKGDLYCYDSNEECIVALRTTEVTFQ